MEKTAFHKVDPWYHSHIENQDNEDWEKILGMETATDV